MRKVGATITHSIPPVVNHHPDIGQQAIIPVNYLCDRKMTSRTFPDILSKIHLATTLREKQQITKEHGIIKHSIFINFPAPAGRRDTPMNLCTSYSRTMLIGLWKGDFHEVDHNDQGYAILEATVHGRSSGRKAWNQ